MSFVILGLVLVVALVELLMELLLGSLNFLINFLDNLVHVLTLADLAKNVALEFQHWLLDDAIVKVDHIRRNLSAEIGILVHYGLEMLLS